jgi:hypothetical protein
MSAEGMPPLPEPVAHMYPADLEKFQESETFAHAFSVAVGRPGERSEPLHAADQVLAYGRLVARECLNIADDCDHRVDGSGYYDQLGDARATQSNIVDAIRKRFNLEQKT